MSKLIIESSDKNDSVTDIEEKLEKAVESIKTSAFPEPFSSASSTARLSLSSLSSE